MGLFSCLSCSRPSLANQRPRNSGPEVHVPPGTSELDDSPIELCLNDIAREKEKSSEYNLPTNPQEEVEEVSETSQDDPQNEDESEIESHEVETKDGYENLVKSLTDYPEAEDTDTEEDEIEIGELEAKTNQYYEKTVSVNEMKQKFSSGSFQTVSSFQKEKSDKDKEERLLSLQETVKMRHRNTEMSVKHYEDRIWIKKNVVYEKYF